MYKISVFLITSAAIIAADVMFGYGQTTAIGARATVSLVAPVSVDNPSPSNIYGPQGLNINAGFYALRYFKTGRMGVKAGLEYGGVPFNLGVDAPRNAFGTGNGGDSQIHSELGTNAFTYAAITLSAAYKVPVKTRFLEFMVGTSVRHYGYGKGGFDELGFAFNRSAPYDPDDPAAGPADVVARINTLDQFHISFPISVDYVVMVNKRTQFKFGIMHNIAIRPLPGDLSVMMYGKSYTGKFSPRTGFWGFNVQFERLSKRSAESYKKHIPVPDIIGRYRKSFFIERHGSGGFLSANYDMRLKKDHNNGIGFKTGLGLGHFYSTEVTNNNKSTGRRLLSIPIGVNYLIGGKRHGLELGIGVTTQIAFDKVREDNIDLQGVTFPLTIGYCFQPIREGLVARVAWVPLAEKSTVSSNFRYNMSNTGISLGYSFK